MGEYEWLDLEDKSEGLFGKVVQEESQFDQINAKLDMILEILHLWVVGEDDDDEWGGPAYEKS